MLCIECRHRRNIRQACVGQVACRGSEHTTALHLPTARQEFQYVITQHILGDLVSLGRICTLITSLTRQYRAVTAIMEPA